MATWLITGATGFLGRHVLDVLDAELANAGTIRRLESWFWAADAPHGWPESQFVPGRSR